MSSVLKHGSDNDSVSPDLWQVSDGWSDWNTSPWPEAFSCGFLCDWGHGHRQWDLKAGLPEDFGKGLCFPDKSGRCGWNYDGAPFGVFLAAGKQKTIDLEWLQQIWIYVSPYQEISRDSWCQFNISVKISPWPMGLLLQTSGLPIQTHSGVLSLRLPLQWQALDPFNRVRILLTGNTCLANKNLNIIKVYI